MSVKIQGLKYLDSNWYEHIIIEQNLGVSSYAIKVKDKNSEIDKIIVTMPEKLSTRIQNLSDEEKVQEIVNYYLENNTIMCLRNQEILPYYQRLFTMVKSKNSYLAFKLYCDKKILYDCVDKYNSDRNSFLETHKDVLHYEVWTTENESSYQQYCLKEQRIIRLHLLKKNGNLWEYDKRFLRQFVLNKLKQQGVPAEIIKPSFCFKGMEVYIDGQPRLICGNLVINLSEGLLRHTIQKVVDEYNESLEKTKVLQLKMEGF